MEIGHGGNEFSDKIKDYIENEILKDLEAVKDHETKNIIKEMILELSGETKDHSIRMKCSSMISCSLLMDFINTIQDCNKKLGQSDIKVSQGNKP